MLVEMGFQKPVIRLFITAQRGEEWFPEGQVVQHRAKSNVQHFPSVEIVQQVGQVVVCPAGDIGDFDSFRRDVIAGPVGGVSFQGKSDNFPE